MVKGYIYKLTSKKENDDRFYFGSTDDIDKRMFEHKKVKLFGRKSKDWFKEIGWENINCLIIKEFDDISRKELRKVEDAEIIKYLHIDPNCLNMNKAFTTKEERKEQIKKYREKNRIEIKKRKKEYYENNQNEIKKYLEDNKDKIKERNKKYIENNKDKIKERNKKYIENNKDKIKERNKNYRENNKIEKYRENNNEDNKEK